MTTIATRRMSTSMQDGWRESSERRPIAGAARAGRARAISITWSARNRSVGGRVSPSGYWRASRCPLLPAVWHVLERRKNQIRRPSFAPHC